MKKEIRNFGEASWAFGTVLCGLGVCLSANSGFGVSMVAAPAYILYMKMSTFFPWLTFGMAEYFLQGILVLFCCIIMGRFKWKYLLSFGTAICYGFCLDLWRLLFGTVIYPLLWQRILSGIAGMFITAFSIALFLRTYLPQEAYELVVKELTEKTGANMHKVKWIYDITSLIVAIFMMLLFFHRFSLDMIGVGTLLLTLCNTPLIALFGRILDKYVSFAPAFPHFYEKFDKLMN
ncbi:MAG: DUF6198 family protein [Lachnospiraceae bacterium]